jgi:hypothetical protein
MLFPVAVDRVGPGAYVTRFLEDSSALFRKDSLDGWIESMAVPKRKHSNSRTGKRRSHDAKKPKQLTSCPKCSTYVPTAMAIKAANPQLTVIVESGDTIPANDTVEKLISALAEDNVGMSGGRPLPENDEESFIGYSVNLLWRLHHQMALISPKLGEMIAFRNIVDSIDEKSAVDEASIEAVITEQGYKIVYIPDAIIHNKGPENISDFIKQRRRIEAGHIWLSENNNYRVVSQNKALLIKLAWKEFWSNPTRIFYFIGTIGLEIYSRLLGKIDYKYKKKNPYKWDISSSTKNLKYK